ncbi:P-loop containing nucleoside triphosphate hydrolase protein [Stipitochalara longipes BDJ]|nr:P-loop containing nucleoside triphosphate hydrolase protein [Stipitochalara longipes BDJ]
MPSLESPRRRRPRAEIESDEDADILRASQRSSPSSTDSAKRVRTNGRHRESQSESPEPGPSRPSRLSHRRHNQYDEDDAYASDVDQAGPSEFQPGAIVRVKLTNFVTYENAEFFPGPNLNMVIGPNGTGKSSLVCAICLGLGWGPQHLGRAGQVGEFVKHGNSDAYVEIELQRRPNESRNHVVRLRIIKDNNGREFWVDGKKTSLKNVQGLMKDLSVQIDNLCQFLPQDKVSSFAGLSPVELLQQTLRAAAPEYMIEWHDELKKLRKEQKELEIQDENDKEQLGRLENRQQNLHAEVERLQERIKVEEKVDLLKKMVPFVEYKIAVHQHEVSKENKKIAQARFKELSERIAPTLRSISAKERYRDQIKIVVEERKQALKTAERDADAFVKTIEDLEGSVKKTESELTAITNTEKKRKQDILQLQAKIKSLKAQRDAAPIEFNSAEWNERVRTKEQESRSILAHFREVEAQYSEHVIAAKAFKQNITEAERELAAFDTQEGQQMSKLENFSKDTAKAWKWVQENLDSFEKEVYGPPMITCSIKDPRYVDAVESCLRPNDFLVITAQTLNDMKKLSDQFTDVMRLGDVTIRQVEEGTSNRRSKPLSQQDFQRAGLDGWAIDFIDGPTPVLEMLVSSAQIDQCPIGLSEPSDEQYNLLAENIRVKRFIIGTNSFLVSRRAEYGPQAVSTSSRGIQPAKYWTDQPIDVSARREIQERIDSLKSEFRELSEKARPLKEEIPNLKEKGAAVKKEIEDIKKEKAELQRAWSSQKALPDRIQAEEETLQGKLRDGDEVQEQRKKLRIQIDHAVLRRAKQTLEYKEHITTLRKCHEELIEAEVRLVEAISDVASLKERNEDTVRERDIEQEKVRTIEAEAKRVKDIARNAMNTCAAIMNDPDNADHIDTFKNIPDGLTVEALHIDIAAEESKLEFIHASNPNAINQYRQFQASVDKLKAKISETEASLEAITQNITKIRDKWEPKLDTLIAKISDAFSYNFEQIGCAGEVDVHKDDDFEQWAIQIKVKFRENETLQQLDAHRQSGGERSVSTIFYLMSLQSMARAPFRVVDEINQGMDPRNERMVHERMVEIACKEHTSQYFLITPKLLTGLRYDKRMKVLCIASGEHMPENYQRMDISKIIGIKRAIMATG